MAADLTEDDANVISDCVYVTEGFVNNWVKRISEPSGILVAAQYPDAAINNVVPHVYEQPNLMQSKTFQELYRRFLAAQKKLLQTYRNFFEPKYADILERKLNGTFQLTSPVPVPKVSAGEPVVEPQQPTQPSQSTQPSSVWNMDGLDAKARGFLQGIR